MEEVTGGRLAYVLAEAAVRIIRESHDSLAKDLGQPLVGELADDLKPGGSIRFTHKRDTGLMLIAVIERRCADFTWHVRIFDKGMFEVLDVVFSVLPTASECEVIRFVAGRWEHQLLSDGGKNG